MPMEIISMIICRWRWSGRALGHSKLHSGFWSGSFQVEMRVGRFNHYVINPLSNIDHKNS